MRALAVEGQNGKPGYEERIETSKASEPEQRRSSFKSVPTEEAIGLE